MFVSNSDLLTELKTIFNEWKNSNGLVIEQIDNKFCSLKSNSNLIIAFPLQLALLLGLKKISFQTMKKVFIDGMMTKLK